MIARFGFYWLVGLCVLLAIALPVLVIGAALNGVYEPLIGTGFAVLIFGPIWVWLASMME